MTVAATYSQTRFASSAYVQWTHLAKSYKLLVSAAEEASDLMLDENNPLQYKIKGQVRIQWMNIHMTSIYLFVFLI